MRLKEYLNSNRIWYHEFAIAANIPLSTLRNYIYNLRQPSLENALEIQRATGGVVTVRDLYEGWNERDPSKTKKRKCDRDRDNGDTDPVDRTPDRKGWHVLRALKKEDVGTVVDKDPAQGKAS